MSTTTALTTPEAIAFLTKDGNFRAPCSRYGHDSESCAPWAVALLAITIDANGPIESSEEDFLDWAMGLVVNNHDDVLSLVLEHGEVLRGTTLGFLIGEASDIAENA